MKKLIVLFSVFFLIMASGILFVAHADPIESWQTANQITVSWDAVEATGGTVRYQVLIQPTDITGLIFLGDPLPVETTAATTYAITFIVNGYYIVGVQSQLMDGDLVLGESKEIAWSNLPAYTKDGVTFGVRYFEIGPVAGLRLGE